MPKTQKPETYRVEFSLSPESVRRLDLLKKAMGFHNRGALLEALLYQGAVDHKVDPYLNNCLQQKMSNLIKGIDSMRHDPAVTHSRVDIAESYRELAEIAHSFLVTCRATR